MNKIWIYGVIGQDPICTMSKNGLEIAKMSIASTRDYDRTKTDWFNLVTFGTSVTNYIKPYIKKGTIVNVWGEITTTIVERDGKKFKSYDIITQSISIVSKKGNQEDLPDMSAASDNQSEQGHIKADELETDTFVDTSVQQTSQGTTEQKGTETNTDPLFSGANDDNWFE